MMLPPGRARLATRPCATGSGVPVITIGIVCVACWAARVAAHFPRPPAPPLGARLTRPRGWRAAHPSPSAPRYTMTRFSLALDVAEGRAAPAGRQSTGGSRSGRGKPGLSPPDPVHFPRLLWVNAGRREDTQDEGDEVPYGAAPHDRLLGSASCRTSSFYGSRTPRIQPHAGSRSAAEASCSRLHTLVRRGACPRRGWT